MGKSCHIRVAGKWGIGERMDVGEAGQEGGAMLEGPHVPSRGLHFSWGNKESGGLFSSRRMA